MHRNSIVFILLVDIILIPSRYITRRHHQKRNVQTLKAPLVHVIFSLSSWLLGYLLWDPLGLVPCGRAVWRLLGGPGDPLGGLWGRSWGGLGEVLGVLEGILDALPPKKAPRIFRGAPKSSMRQHQEAPRGSRGPPKGAEETVFEAPKAMKIG